jgi:SulP family sulfate permease
VLKWTDHEFEFNANQGDIEIAISMSDAAIQSRTILDRMVGGLNAPVARSVIAGVVVGIFSLLFYVSYAALIFSGPLSPWLAHGLTATFITGAIGGMVTSLRSSLPFAIGGPDGSTCAVTAALVGTLAARLAANGADAGLLTATLVALALCTALTGLLLCGLGLAQLGRAIRFIPYPVIGGFLGASGCLMLMGALKVMTGYRLTLANIGNVMDVKLLGGFAIAAFLLVGRKYWKTPLAMPVQLLVSVVIFYIVLLLLGVPIADAQANGWMFVLPSARAFALPSSLELGRFPWNALPELGADFIAVMFVSTISILLNITAIELATKKEASLDRELKVQGVANLLCASLGGYVSCITSTRSRLNFTIGNNSRVAGLIIAAMSAASLFINPEFLGYMPKCVLGGLLLTIGYDSVWRWIVGTASQLARLEYLSLLAIALIIVFWGFLPGVSIGVIFGCATFALSAGRINVIKFAFDGSEYRSSLDRGPQELSLLAAHGRELQGLRLQSYLFFGSANRLYEHVKALLAQNPECRFLLIDFGLVTGTDSSAVHSFTQIKQAVSALGARLVLVNLTPPIEKAFSDNQFISKDVLVVPELDRGLEHCENEIISAHSGAGSEAGSLRDWLTTALGDAELATLLASKCKRYDFDVGDILALQGAPSDSMHFIVDGRVGIIVNLEGGRSIRVRSLGRLTTVGEMGLLTGRPRSASVQAEVATIAYELRADAFERLKVEHPALMQALLTFVIGLMAERLSFASKVIGVLQR